MAKRETEANVDWKTTSTAEASYSSRCGVCKGQFQNSQKSTLSEGTHHHPHCFKCGNVKCDSVIKGRYRITSKGQRECERCVLGDDPDNPEKHSVSVKIGKSMGICGVCEKQITGKFSKPETGPLKGKIYHRTCFACKDCKKEIGSEPYAHNGEIILCANCVKNYKTE